MNKAPNTFSFIGPGRVGSSFALALCKSGWKCITIVGKKESAEDSTSLRKAFPESRITDSIADLSDDIDVLFIAVQDDRIVSVVEHLLELGTMVWKQKTVLHMSGAISLEVLTGLRNRGASVGAFHPIAPFVNRLDPEAARNIYYDFLGDRGAEAVAHGISRQLNSKLLILKSERKKTLLHLASAFASNSTLIAVRSAERLISSFIGASDSKNLIENLLLSTFRNLSAGTDMKSLTGPLKRGDAGVISQHLKALENEPRLLQFYISWSLLGVDELLKVEHDASRKARLKKIKKILEEN